MFLAFQGSVEQLVRRMLTIVTISTVIMASVSTSSTRTAATVDLATLVTTVTLRLTSVGQHLANMADRAPTTSTDTPANVRKAPVVNLDPPMSVFYQPHLRNSFHAC